jgi:hypothetical protein
MQTLWNVLTIIGAVESILLVIAIVYALVLWARGIFPALLRFGNGLARRKIAIFAKGDNMSSLKHLLLDSKLFREKNICEIAKKEDIGRAEAATVFLVFWHDWTLDIDEILHKKPDECALVVYAPYDQGRIPDAQMKKLDGKRHTSVTNFRGRLLNDIVASMITTGYEAV